MKKIKIFLAVVLLTVTGCGKKENVPTDNSGYVATPAPTVDSEKAVTMINECITDYNDDMITERESEWSTSIPPMPIEIDHIDTITSLDQLNNVETSSENDNSIYTGVLPIDRYNMVFKIYLSGNSFWLYGDVYFTVNLDTVVENDPQFANIKTTLDTLLSKEPNVIDWLYGVNITVAETESSSHPGYYLVTAMGNNHPKTIQDLKNVAEEVFPIEFLEPFYISAFEGEDAIYIEEDGNLYAYDSESNIYDGTPYDTSKIIAVEEIDNMTYIDILVTYGEETSDRLERIELINTDSGYKLNNTY